MNFEMWKNELLDFVSYQESCVIEMNLQKAEFDHVCFRVSEFGRYELYKEMLAANAFLIQESFVNSRPIALFELTESLRTASGLSISLIELPAPKDGVLYSEGFEHTEWVVSKSDLSKFELKNDEAVLKVLYGSIKLHSKFLRELVAQEKLAMQEAKTHIIFDLDGTLVNSENSFQNCLFKTVESTSNLNSNAALRELLQGLKMAPTFSEILHSIGISKNQNRENFIQEFGKIWTHQNYSAQTQPIVGAKTLLSCLFEAGFSLHLWTARDEISAVDLLNFHGLKNYFSSFHFCETNGNSKPSIPQNMKCSLYGSKRRAYVGDSLVDEKAAKAIDAKFISIFQLLELNETNLQKISPFSSVCEKLLFPKN